MIIKERIEADTQKALKSGDVLRRSVLIMVKAAIHDKEIAKGKDNKLSDDDYLAVVRQEAKKRKDAILEFEKAGRDDLAKKEKEELEVLKEYLPAQLSTEEVREELKKMVEELGSEDKENFGRVMAEAMKKFGGRAEGTIVRQELEKLLE